jgi:hypothetical protein
MPNGLPYGVELDVILQRGSVDAVCSLCMNRQCLSSTARPGHSPSVSAYIQMSSLWLYPEFSSVFFHKRKTLFKAGVHRRPFLRTRPVEGLPDQPTRRMGVHRLQR